MRHKQNTYLNQFRARTKNIGSMLWFTQRSFSIYFRMSASSGHAVSDILHELAAPSSLEADLRLSSVKLRLGPE